MANGSACGHGYMHAKAIWSSGMIHEGTPEESLMRDDTFFHAPDLHGQVALITGGGRGLGRAFAQALAAAGAAVVITARSQDQVQETARLIMATGGQALAIPGDVTDAPTVAQVVHVATQHFGAIDILINNAGVIA